MEILAPLSGVVVPLDSIPDPVFAGRLAGDGAAIDPTSSEVLAPVGGRVTQLHQSCHALAITADNGVEVLLHVGLDTVSLKGKGFEALVALGARVERGQRLLRFDAEVLARTARSLLTEVVVTTMERVVRLSHVRGCVEAGKSVLLTLELSKGQTAAAAAPPAGEAASSDWVRLPNLAGLHARPAAVFANEARKFAAGVRLVRGGEAVNAKSVVAVMGLSTEQGDRLRVEATGADAKEAVARLARLLVDGCGEAPGEAPRPAPGLARPTLVPLEAPDAPGSLIGAAAAPGLAIGRILQHRHGVAAVPETGGPAVEERARFVTACRTATLELEQLKKGAPEPARAQILGVHLSLLQDPDLHEHTEAGLMQGKSAAFAWQAAFTQHAARLEALKSQLLRERAADVRDVGRRVLDVLTGTRQAPLALPDDCILVAEEVTPSEMASFDRRRLLGLCTTTGSSTGHVAILARSMGVPAICGIHAAALAVPDGTRATIDGTRGLLSVNPDDAALATARERLARESARLQVERAAAFSPARTRDGHRLEVVANIGSLAEAQEAMAGGAEGVGLLRSEFLFHGRDTAPSEAEQAQTYQAIAAAVGRQRPLVVRTLDVGGDKPLAYLPLPKEQNPFLGLRGIRVSLAHPEMFRAQLRAILRAAPDGDVHVMFPMVAGLDELRAAKAMLAEERRSLPHPIKVGVMIEVPSAALLAEALAQEVDFLSIGTNDLTQYTLAMDRGDPRLAAQADALHPGVLKLIALTVEGARKHKKWVGVCGGIASDPLAVPLLTGLGVDELSVSVPAVASVKATLARWSLEECKALATHVLSLRTTGEIRALLAAHAEAGWDRAGLAQPGPASPARLELVPSGSGTRLA